MIIDNIKSMFSVKSRDETTINSSLNKVETNAINANYLFTVTYDGEKSKGEIGIIKKYNIDFINLRNRSWQFYLDNSIAHLIINRLVLWVVGSGLKLQSEPMIDILKANEIDIDQEEFSTIVENRFKLFCSSKRHSYNGRMNIHSISNEVVKSAYIGGDVLVIQRYEDSVQTAQIVDGRHILTPPDYDEIKRAKAKGNRIVEGVEINSKGQHVAFYVKEDDYSHVRVEARDNRGREVAFLVYGLKYSEDDTRGIPIITAVMETIKKIDRYTEATVSSAEERQKIAYQILHNELSSGASPITSNIKSGVNKAHPIGATYEISTSEHISQTTEKSVFNMEAGSELKQLSSDNELSFKDFHKSLSDLIYITIGLSPEFALAKYDGSYSGSRGSIKDSEHTLEVKRDSLWNQFHKPVYEYWLDINILNDKIKADKYKEALLTNNYEVLDSFRNARWVGASVPHIDPLKEVKAERAKLGILADHIPLTTIEMATQNVKGGDSTSNISQFIKEIAKIDKNDYEKENMKNQNNKLNK